MASGLNPHLSRFTFRGLAQVGRSRIELTPYLFLLPPLVIYIVFLFYPLLDTVRLSFTEYAGIGTPAYVGLDNFRALLEDERFWNALRVTLTYSAGVVTALTVIPFFEALLFNQALRGITWFRALSYLPVIMSMVVVGLIWKYIYYSDGLLSNLLRLAGLTQSSIGFLADPNLALFSIMWVTIWKASPYYAMIYLAGLQTIPREQIEAALVDGANRWQVTRYITLPWLQPYVAVVALIATIGAMKVFAEVYVMTQGGPIDRTYVMNFYIYELGFRFFRMGYASAVGTALLLLVLAITLVGLRVMDQAINE